MILCNQQILNYFFQSYSYFTAFYYFNFFTWSIWAGNVNDQIVRERAKTAHPKSATQRHLFVFNMRPSYG
jgi:hypothetical protein